MLGATDAEINALVNNPDAARQQAMDGQSCWFVYSGKDALKFWDFDFSLPRRVLPRPAHAVQGAAVNEMGKGVFF